MKIGLDAGHGLNTAGKQTPDGIKEWTLNDKVRDKVVDILKDYDVEIVFTDNDEGSVDESLTERRTTYVNAKVDAFVSIHHNAYTGTWNDATGVEIYTDRNFTNADDKLAHLIYKNLPDYTGLKGRGIKRTNWTVINQNKIPAVLVEGGFMDSNNDYKVITSEQGQLGYARAVAEGLIEFLGLKKKQIAPQVTKSIVDLANEVIAGKHGTGSARKKALGSLYNEVQAKVNEILKGKKTQPKPVLKSVDVIAKEVLEGKWGNGAARKQKLTAAGYDYNAVQKRVNQLLK
jgi:N-acetylmuramoyl-L-alanine amidase